MPVAAGHSKERIALFGGSFDPPHIGHNEICKWVFSKGLCEQLWVIPCYEHPFGKNLLDFDHRLKMCRMAFGKLLLPISVLETERDIGGTSHTLRTILYLKGQYPEASLHLLVGGDVAEQMDDWYEFDKIRRNVAILEVPRGGNSPIPDVSSTEIRENITRGKQFTHMLEPEVAVYIVTNGLYRKE